MGELTDGEIAAIFDSSLLSRLFESLNHLSGMNLLTAIDSTPNRTTLPPNAATILQNRRVVNGEHATAAMPFGAMLVHSFISRTKATMPVKASMVFTLKAVAVIESPLTAQDPFRGALIQASPEHLQRTLELRTQPRIAAPSGSLSAPLATFPPASTHSAASGYGISSPSVQRVIAPVSQTTSPGAAAAAEVGSGISHGVSRLLPVVPRHIAVADEKQMLPDTRLHVLASVQRAPGEMFYRLEYNVTTWGGWLGFWDHVAAIRGDKSLGDSASGLLPFVGARELLNHGTMYARKQLRDALYKVLAASKRQMAAEEARTRRRELRQSQQAAPESAPVERAGADAPMHSPAAAAAEMSTSVAPGAGPAVGGDAAPGALVTGACISHVNPNK